MKKLSNSLLVLAVIISLVLLFWPFAEWDGGMDLILRVLPAFGVQMLLCGGCKSNFVKAIPVLLTGALTAWGTYLFFTSPHWRDATVGDLMGDYISPFFGCIAGLLLCFLRRKRE